jgi:hypothetical protein
MIFLCSLGDCMIVAFIFALIISMCPVLVAKAPKIESSRPKELLTRYTEERFDGKTFAHRVDIADGERKERWAIDGEFVDKDTYNAALAKAEQAERQVLRQLLEEQRTKEEDELMHQQQFMKKSQVDLGKKEIQLNLTKLESAFAQLKDPKLISYHVFDQNSCSDLQQLSAVHTALISEAKSLLDQMNEVVAEADFSAMKTKLDQHSKRLQTMFQSAVNNAIEMCDDTKFLKELLATLV